MDSRPSASLTLAGAIFLVVFGAGLISGANLPDRLAREIPKPVPGFWKWLDDNLPRRKPTFAELHPEPSHDVVQIVMTDFLATYDREGMTGLVARTRECYADWLGMGHLRTRAALMRCALLDRVIVRYDYAFRHKFPMPGGGPVPQLYRYLEQDQVLARRRATAKELFGGEVDAQDAVLETYMMAMFREMTPEKRATPKTSRPKPGGTSA